jgi:hypothetical protein
VTLRPQGRHRRESGSGPVALLVAALVAVLAASTGCGAGPAIPTDQVAQLLATPSGGQRPTAVAGRLVTGFPTVVPVPAGAHVTASAMEPHGDLLAVSVTGTSRQPLAALLAYIRDRLTRAGFTATDGSLLPAGASGAAFGRHAGTEMLIVAVVDRGTERSFSIGGTVSGR